jgi:hypothetical protein
LSPRAPAYSTIVSTSPASEGRDAHLERDEHDGRRTLVALLGLFVDDGRREGLDDGLSLLLGHTTVESEYHTVSATVRRRLGRTNVLDGDYSGVLECCFDAVEMRSPLISSEVSSVYISGMEVDGGLT